MIKPHSNIDDWIMARLGQFTSSENYKLLGNASDGKTFGAGAMTYIKTKAIEASSHLWERPALEETASLLWGKVYEYPAYEEYIHVTKNYSMTYLGTETPLFLSYEPLAGESGGSPDIVNITSSDTVDHGCELKCSKNPMFHFDRLIWKSMWDIKENYLSCYTQVQHLMMVTGAKTWDFMSFDDRQRIRANKSKIIEVKPDLKFQNNLEMRIRIAIKEKYAVMSKHFNLEIKNRAEMRSYFNSQAKHY